MTATVHRLTGDARMGARSKNPRLQPRAGVLLVIQSRGDV